MHGTLVKVTMRAFRAWPSPAVASGSVTSECLSLKFHFGVKNSHKDIRFLIVPWGAWPETRAAMNRIVTTALALLAE